MWLLINNIHEKILRCLSRRNADVSHNQGKIAPSIVPSRVCAWFENKRFDWLSVSFVAHWPIRMLGLLPLFSPFCTCQSFLISTFCTNFVFLQVFALFGINWHALSQSAWWNFCMYIIRYETSWWGPNFHCEDVMKLTFWTWTWCWVNKVLLSLLLLLLLLSLFYSAFAENREKCGSSLSSPDPLLATVQTKLVWNRHRLCFQ